MAREPRVDGLGADDTGMQVSDGLVCIPFQAAYPVVKSKRRG